MHHVALDGTGADDGDLDDEVVEFLRFETRQHVHLRAALHLEDTDGVGFAQHVVDGGVIARHGGEVVRLAFVHADEVERLADAGEHAERQHVDLHHAEAVDVVLVPFDEVAILHRGGTDGHDGVKPVLRQHEAADMLGEMAGEADQLVGEGDGAVDQRVLRIEIALADLALLQLRAVAAPDAAGDGGGNVFGEAEDLADFADGTARAVADHGGGEGGAALAIALVDVLDHLLAPFVLEIDVDIRRLAALLADEALEQQIDLGGVDGGDAEHITDGGVGGRAAALAEDAAPLGEADDLAHGEEVMRDAELLDQPQLFFQRGADGRGHAAGIMERRTLPRHVFEVALRGLAGRHRLVGIVVLDVAEREADAVHETDGLGERFGRVAEQMRHLAGRFQMALGIGFEPVAGGVERDMLADAGDDVLQRTPLGHMIEHVVDGDERHARGAGDAGKTLQAAGVVAMMEHAGGEPDALWRDSRQGFQKCRQVGVLGPGIVLWCFRGGTPPTHFGDWLFRVFMGRRGRHHDEKQAFLPFFQVASVKRAFALDGAMLSGGEQAAEIAIGGTVHRIGEDIGCAVGKNKARADQQFRFFAFQAFDGIIGAHHAGQRVAVGDADGGKPELRGTLHQLLRVGGAAQEGEVGGDGDLGIGRHALPVRRDFL